MRKRSPTGFFQQSRLTELASRFNTVEKTSDTTYVRHIAVVEVATGKVNVFKDVPSDNSYYPKLDG